jgi:uncharacterized protein YndB with AHSA1/START domain
MEQGTLEKQIHIAASPATVYEIVSSPAHIAQWWSDEAEFTPEPGAPGRLTWAAKAHTSPTSVQIMVVEATPYERFAFRWEPMDSDSPATAGSVLVTFTIKPDGEGTLLKVAEDGLREQGWEAAVLEEYYASHDDGWTRHLADLARYAAERAVVGAPR